MKVEVSIRQRRFVGLIGHPHVFVPIMVVRAEEPAGRRAAFPGGRLSHSLLHPALPAALVSSSDVPHSIALLAVQVWALHAA